MASRSRLTAVFGAGLLVLLVDIASAKEYRLGCTAPPFPVTADQRPIDLTCPNEGNSPVDSPKGQQNQVKNNLCSAGNPMTLTIADFASLQEQVTKLGVPFGADGFGSNRVEHLPTDRSILSSGKLKTIAGRPVNEGDKVQIVALMDDPHPADLGNGEDVNCNNKHAPENDVHINLTEITVPALPKKNDPDKQTRITARNAALCDAKAIVAEVIPHFRPAIYEAQNLISIAEQHIPVRVSGQLFFDAAHRPCHGSTPGDSSVRGSLWEIHPIYSIEVCMRRTLDECSASDEQAWVPVHQVVTPFEADRAGEHEGE
jgi:hypothetical protein